MASEGPGENEQDRQTFSRTTPWAIGTFALVAYLLWGTGIVSDDFYDIVFLKSQSFPKYLIPQRNFINVPVGHFTHHIWFRFFEPDGHLIDCLKILWTSLSLLLIFRFFRIFHDGRTSLIVSLLFAFHPSHDSIPFWYAPAGHLLAMAVYFEAYTQCSRSRLKLAVALAFLASFMVYGSTPTALALGALCLLEKRFKWCAALVTPNLIYAGYFLSVSHFGKLSPSRFLEPIGLDNLIKNFGLQVLTFVDALMGPSLLLKIFYSAQELAPISGFIGLCLLVPIYRCVRGSKARPNLHLLLALALLAVLSWVMFSFTGRYPQMAFNLGNRATFWGSLLVSYLIVVAPAPKQLRFGILAILMFSILGISDHWRQWQSHQQLILTTIRNNSSLKQVNRDEIILVSGNQYSKLGPLSHLEFLSEDWVVSRVFMLADQPCKIALPLNKNRVYSDEHYRSKKKNRARWALSNTVWLYDSENDTLQRLPVDKINSYIKSLPVEARHWSQLQDNSLTRAAKSVVYFLMPRLEKSNALGKRIHRLT